MPDQNKTLSERRAEAVVSYLTSKYQIDPARLQAVGMGEDGCWSPPPTIRRKLAIAACWW